MSFILHDHPAVCHSCTDYVPLDVSFIQRALSADIVLYGKDMSHQQQQTVHKLQTRRVTEAISHWR